MKTRTLILVALALSIFSVTNLHAGEKDAVPNAEQTLREEIKEIFYNVPYEGVMGDESVSTISVEFKINKDHKLQVISVNGENERLVRYAYNKLSQRTIKASPLLDGNGYSINLRFVTE